MWVARAMIRAMALALAFLPATVPDAAAQTPAKELFGARQTPAAMRPESVGFYSRGCVAGAVAMPRDGPTWQVMRLSRNRVWGHPAMIAFLKRFSADAAAGDNWRGLLLGDIAQPRGGPMTSGHASHQIGLDADIYLTEMPARRLGDSERESLQPRSLIDEKTLHVDERVWRPEHLRLIRRAALDRNVQRIFVHPGIKAKLCAVAGGNRAWLNKVRPIYGHDYHFHVRLFCQDGSPGCEPQESTGRGDGCGDLDWWFDVALQPPPPGARPPKPKPPLTMAQLPKSCSTILDAPSAPPVSAEARGVPAAPQPAAAFAPETERLPMPRMRPVN